MRRAKRDGVSRGRANFQQKIMHDRIPFPPLYFNNAPLFREGIIYLGRRFLFVANKVNKRR